MVACPHRLPATECAAVDRGNLYRRLAPERAGIVPVSGEGEQLACRGRVSRTGGRCPTGSTRRGLAAATAPHGVRDGLLEELDRPPDRWGGRGGVTDVGDDPTAWGGADELAAVDPGHRPGDRELGQDGHAD